MAWQYAVSHINTLVYDCKSIYTVCYFYNISTNNTSKVLLTKLDCHWFAEIINFGRQ